MNQYNFHTSGSHKVILSGEEEQTVAFDDPSSKYSHFNELVINNTSGQVSISEMAVVKATYVNATDTEDILKLPSLKVSSMDFTLQEDLSIELIEEGVALLSGATLNLNGHTLTIKGDLIHSGGTLNVNGGKLIVTGDYRLQTPTEEGYTSSGGRLYMAKEADYVDVGGDFVVDGNYSYLNTNSFTAGTLELKGNFSQLSTGDSSLNQYNFHTSGSHKVILSGEEEQTVAFDDPSSKYSHFNELVINNTSGQVSISEMAVVKATYVNATDTEDILKLPSLKVSSMDFTLQEDLSIELIEEGVALLSGATLNLNGHTLTIKGDLIHSGGTLNVNGGKLIVTGDYRLQTPTEEGYTSSGGRLYMAKEADYVNVGSDFVVDGNYTYLNTDSFTAGTLELKRQLYPT